MAWDPVKGYCTSIDDVPEELRHLAQKFADAFPGLEFRMASPGDFGRDIEVAMVDKDEWGICLILRNGNTVIGNTELDAFIAVAQKTHQQHREKHPFPAPPADEFVHLNAPEG